MCRTRGYEYLGVSPPDCPGEDTPAYACSNQRCRDRVPFPGVPAGISFHRVWAGEDSNLRTRKGPDLQSGAFNHFATYPSSIQANHISMSCGRGDSDSHGFHHRNLNPARLPVSPQPHEKPRQSAGAVMLFIYLTMRMRREPDTGGRKPEGVQGRKPDPCRAHNSYYMALYLFQYVKEHRSESPERPFGHRPCGQRRALAGPGSGAIHENVYPTCATCNFIYGYKVCCSVLTPYVFRNTSGFIPKNLSGRP